MATLHLFPCNKQVLVICICFPLNRFGFLATFCWLWYWWNTYLETQILIDNQITSRVKFCNSDLLGVLATNYSPQVVVNCWESPCQTYKSPSIDFVVLQMVPCCLISNLYLVFYIDGLHFYFFDNKVQV